jgi:hypothetical protein
MEQQNNPGTKEIIYNVTVKIAQHLAERWLQWMLQEHIPEIMDTGCFSHYRVARLLEVDDSEGPTYAVQYHASSIEMYHRYLDEHAEQLRNKSYEKWGNGFIAFRSVLQVVQ